MQDKHERARYECSISLGMHSFKQKQYHFGAGHYRVRIGRAHPAFFSAYSWRATSWSPVETLGNTLGHSQFVLRRLEGGGLLQIAALGRRLSSEVATLDRKSTRLNSSHLGISYAVFCL